MIHYALTTALFIGCAPSYTVVRQATPNPFTTGQCKVQVQDVEGAGWQPFAEELIKQNPQIVTKSHGGILLKAKITAWQPGTYAYESARDSEASMTAQFTDANGVVLDEVALTTRVPAIVTNPSVDGRQQSAAKQLARQLTGYLRDRMDCR